MYTEVVIADTKADLNAYLDLADGNPQQGAGCCAAPAAAAPAPKAASSCCAPAATTTTSQQPAANNADAKKAQRTDLNEWVGEYSGQSRLRYSMFL